MKHHNHQVHLVGSIPLENPDQVFRTVSSKLGDRVKRIPDGETGIRTNWVGWQYQVFTEHPRFEPVPREREYTGIQSPTFRLRDPEDTTPITFDNLGYADEAKASYATFADLKAQGVIDADTRFQVCLPTAIATLLVFLAPEAQQATEPGYEARIIEEAQEIAASIPHDQLAIQWDIAVEFGVLEGVWPNGINPTQEGIVARLVNFGQSIPSDIEMGYHLCYGDAQHRHFKQPADTGLLVEIANAVSAGVTRPINWIHLPVPRDRSDVEYFEPLKGLKLHHETELYLGLVHYTDGVEGTEARVAAAKNVIEDFGIGTECGMGRRASETIPALLNIHASVAG